MGSPPTDTSAKPPAEENGEVSKATAEAEESEPKREPEKAPMPPRRQTMEVQMAWLDLRQDEPRVEQIVTPAPTEVAATPSLTPISDSLKSEPRLPASDEEEERTRAVPVAQMRPRAKSVHPISDALRDDNTDIADEFPEPPAAFDDEEAPTALRKKPPRIPGAMRTLPPMPVALSSRPKPPSKPPPPRRNTQEVEMAWVELVDDDVVEIPPSENLPKISYDEDEDEPKKAVRPSLIPAAIAAPKPDPRIAAEEARRERLSQFLQAAGSIPPGALRVSDLKAAPSEEDHESMRAETLAARKREQDLRDRAILERRRAERVRERLEQEAKQRRRELEREEEERAAAMRTGAQDKSLLDLSGIDEEIDKTLDDVFGPNLSYPPPPKK